eukprot:TRINITY_DN3966_c0_g1_i1.p1 TRINITY_DN3966_c0_g1~~TRINITY_DN3966_c0_g1_i1.p1  ORF type:complete len:440 (-),score=102.26 TRINITY_DN3966_c0_g1_i1:86-1354(-)
MFQQGGNRFVKPVIKKAAFRFRGVIVAENKEQASRLRQTLEHICATIIEAYRVCNEQNIPNEVKIQKIHGIGTLRPQIEFIDEFCRSEAQACKVPSVQKRMLDIYHDVKQHVDRLKEDFDVIRSDTSIYDDVFDQLMTLLQAVTAFMREGHSVEISRLLEVADRTISAAEQLRDLQRVDSLVEIAQFASKKIIDLMRSVKHLVGAQEITASLNDRLQTCQDIMQSCLPGFIRRTRDKLVSPTEDNITQHGKATRQVFSCLEEVVQIIKDVQVCYESELLETLEDYEPPGYLKNLDSAVKGVSNMLAKLHTAVEDAEKDQLSKGVGEMARAIVGHLGEGSLDADKVAFVQAIKEGMNDDNAQFFASQRKLADLMSSVKSKAKMNDFELEGETGDETKDLIGAAQDMLSALKGITQALDIPGLG